MKHKSLIVASLLLCLGGCDWWDDDDDPVLPPDPEPEQSVSINEAESLKVALSAVDPQSQALTFSLTTAEGKPVKDAGSNYLVMYLKMPAEQVSAFSMLGIRGCVSNAAKPSTPVLAPWKRWRQKANIALLQKGLRS